MGNLRDRRDLCGKEKNDTSTRGRPQDGRAGVFFTTEVTEVTEVTQALGGLASHTAGCGSDTANFLVRRRFRDLRDPRSRHGCASWPKTQRALCDLGRLLETRTIPDRGR